MSGQGSRYQRSFPGMVGALLVTLVVIGAFVATRALSRDQAEVQPDRVDHEAAVRYAVERGVAVVHPTDLPEGWFARDVTVGSGEGPVWSLDLLTDEDRYLGIHQESADPDRLVDRLVDEDATEAGTTPVSGPLEGTVEQWRVFTDDGGDYALVGEIDHATVPEGQVLVVVGTAGEDTVRDFASTLTLSTPNT